jgi:hypothetical protein
MKKVYDFKNRSTTMLSLGKQCGGCSLKNRASRQGTGNGPCLSTSIKDKHFGAHRVI